MVISITPKFASCLFEIHFPHPSTLHNPVIPKQTLICFLSLWFSLHFLEFYINGITFQQAFCSISISSFMCWTDQWFILFYWWIAYIYLYILICPLTHYWWIFGFFPVFVVQVLNHVQLFVTHGLQHARLHCSLLFPRICSNLCPWSWWYYLTISSFVAHFSLGLLHVKLLSTFVWTYVVF